jgi:outer membrane protein OmpA-like peptidoglycan-associated protein
MISADVQFLTRYPDAKILIQGHCDERGSEVYNMSFGENRAEQAKDQLVKQGVSADRIKVISIGKKVRSVRPKMQHAFPRNRRAHFVLRNTEQASRVIRRFMVRRIEIGPPKLWIGGRMIRQTDRNKK